MKIAFDLDDTITRFPNRFRKVMKALVNAGIEVLVMTGQPSDTDLQFDQQSEEYKRNAIDRKLRQFKRHGIEKGVHYHELVIVPGNTHGLVAHRKGVACKDMNISILIDNDPLYCEAVLHNSPKTAMLHLR